MQRKSELYPFWAVNRGDTLWGIARDVFPQLSNVGISAKVDQIAKFNPHLRSPDHIMPGQVLFLGLPSGACQAPVPVSDLCELERTWGQMTPQERRFVSEHWDVLAALSNEYYALPDSPSFVDQVTIKPAPLQHRLNPRSQQPPLSDRFKKVGMKVYGEVASADNLPNVFGAMGATALQTAGGHFGNFLKTSPFVWAEVEGELVRSFNRNVRYIRQSNNVLRMVPNGSRALMGSKGQLILVAKNTGAGFQSFSQNVKFSKNVSRGIMSPKGVGGVFIAVDFGIAGYRVHRDWDTPQRYRTMSSEGGRVSGGMAAAWLGGVAAPVVCGLLTFTTGPGGIACFLIVAGGFGIAGSSIGKNRAEAVYDHFNPEVLYSSPKTVPVESCAVPKQ